MENYCLTLLLLPVCGKILEQLIYNKMFKFFTENEIISQNQSGSNQGIPASISYYVSLTVFINDLMMVSRQEASFMIYQKHWITFWYKGLHYKLKQNSISGNL